MRPDYLNLLGEAPVFVRDSTGCVVAWPAGAERLFGFTAAEALGAVAHDLLQTQFPTPRQEIETELREAGCWQGLLEHTSKAGVVLSTESQWRLVTDASGERFVVETNADVTRRELLARELDHRVKNILTVVQSLARLTFSSSDADDVRRFEDRLIALSKAHLLLLEDRWQQADLRDLVERIAGALNFNDRLRMSGPAVRLSPDFVVSFALSLHELGTNALKHGALASPQGSVDIDWTLEGEGGGLRLAWRERDGPPVAPPTRQGFGSRLIQRAMRASGTSVAITFAPTGVVCIFEAPAASAARKPA